MEKTGDEMIDNLTRMLRDHLSELLQDTSNKRIQDKTRHADTHRRRRREIERKKLEKIAVRPEFSRVPSHYSAPNTEKLQARLQLDSIVSNRKQK